jgi:hypothetical protein
MSGSPIKNLGSRKGRYPNVVGNKDGLVIANSIHFDKTVTTPRTPAGAVGGGPTLQQQEL